MTNRVAKLWLKCAFCKKKKLRRFMSHIANRRNGGRHTMCLDCFAEREPDEDEIQRRAEAIKMEGLKATTDPGRFFRFDPSDD